jgi:hypothetical protein
MNWLEQLCEVRRKIQLKERETLKLTQDDPGKRTIKPKETVVNSQSVIWKPIDRIAARVVAPAQWICKPPDQPNKKPKPMNQNIKSEIERVPITKNGPLKSDQMITDEIVQKFHHQTKTTMVKTGELLEMASDSRAALDQMTELWKKDWLDFMDQSNNRLRDLRMFRMALDSETRQVLSTLREVRNFFLEENHDSEIQKLREFVEVIERLQALKQSGVLDLLIDSMLKLA